MYKEWRTDLSRDCNPGLEFSIPGFGIVEFPILGSRDPVGIGRRSIVKNLRLKTAKIATWATVRIRVAIFEVQVCMIVLYGFSADVL